MNEINYSIIIPHKDIPELLQRCLNSIPRRKDIQIIVVDDNSTPDKVDFEHFPGIGEPCVEVYFTKEGKGAGYARNIGLKHAKGKWLLFADADDFYTSDALSLMDKYCMTENDIIYFSIDRLDSATLKTVDERLNINTIIENFIAAAKNSSETQLRYINWVPWNKMFNKNYILSNGIVFEEILKGNDAMFVLMSGHLAKNITADKGRLYVYTYRSNSVSYIYKKEYLIAVFLLKIRINKFYKNINHPELHLFLFRDIILAYKNGGKKECIKFLKIAYDNKAFMLDLRVIMKKIMKMFFEKYSFFY